MESREQILGKITENQAKIKSFGVKRLALFGSFERNQANKQSDLDFVVEFEHKTFDAYMGLKQYLEELFDRPVDLVLPNTIKPRLRSQILGNMSVSQEACTNNS